MNFKKEIKKILPPVLLVFLQKIFCFFKFFLFLVRNHRTLKNNKKLKDLFKGKRAFVVATGPSIKGLPLNLLNSELVVTLSNAFLHDAIDDINPEFHIFAPYHLPLNFDNYVEWLRESDKRLPAKTKIFLDVKTKEMVSDYKIFNGREVFYAYFSGSPFILTDNLCMPLLSPQTVPHMSLPLLSYLGVVEIFLLGCDHDVLRDYKSDITHFFSSKQEIRLHASDSSVWTGIIESHYDSLNVFLIYEKYLNLLKKKSVQLYNLSDKSWLDFVPKKKFLQVLSDKDDQATLAD